MATITITVGNITVDKTVPDDRLQRVLEWAFEPDPTWVQRRQLNHGLDAMWESARQTARYNRSRLLRQQTEDQISQEI